MSDNIDLNDQLLFVLELASTPMLVSSDSEEEDFLMSSSSDDEAANLLLDWIISPRSLKCHSNESISSFSQQSKREVS